MKMIYYKVFSIVNAGTAENSMPAEAIVEKHIPYTEANEAIAQKEAYNGEYTVEDDGQPNPEPTPSGDDSAVWDELDAAYQEGVDSV
jgi:hypothetical protein